MPDVYYLHHLHFVIRSEDRFLISRAKVNTFLNEVIFRFIWLIINAYFL